MKNIFANPKTVLNFLAPFSTKLTVFSVGLFLALSAVTYGTITISALEDGDDVIFSVAGSVDVAGIDPSPVFSSLSIISPDKGNIAKTAVGDGFYDGILTESVPTFGTGPTSEADETSGDNFGVSGTALFLPAGYTDAELNVSMTFSGETFNSLGITSGFSYTRTLDLAGGNTDTLQFTAIPEPNSYGVLLGAAGLATAVFLRRRRRSSAS